MLVLHSASRCDVCLLEYTGETSAKVPHAIACGHIFCRDCLYSTIPPLCPLCRKQYLPAKIKKLHVDRPENVDEVREVELARRQLELLEKLVEVWDVELSESTVSNPNSDGDDAHEHGTVVGLEVQGNVDRGEVQEEVVATSRVRHVRILAGAQLLGDEEDDGELDDNVEPQLSEEWDTLQLGQDVEQILDGIAGEPGVGRGFLARWGTSITNGNAERWEHTSTTLKEVQRIRLAEVLEEVDMWLGSKDEDTGLALRKSRLFFAQHLTASIALKEALDLVKSLGEARSKLLDENQEMERVHNEERKTATEELGRFVGLVEQLTTENQDLKLDLSLMLSSPKSYTETNMSSLRNPLPPPPEPVATKHLPTFAQAMSESTGSIFGGSVYSPAASNFGSSLAMVQSLSPSSPPRERERYISGVDDGNSRHAIPTGDTSRSRKRKGKGKETSHSHSHSYRHDLGHFDESGLQQSTSMSSIYPTSVPVVQSSTPTQHSSRPHVPVSNSSLPAGASSGTYAVRKVAQFANEFDHAHSTSHSYPTRSTALHMQFENTSQPVDAFTLTSAYLREYSAGFINGQEAALGTRSFAQPPTATTQYSASQGLSRTNRRRDDLPHSLIYTAESAEGEVRGRDGQILDSRSRSRSQSRSRPTSLSNNLTSSSLVSPPTHSRRHLSVVSLPSTSSHSYPSPSFSLSSNIERPTHNSNRNSSSEAHGQQVGSPTPSIASSGRILLPSLAQDPIAAAARRSPSGRTIESWGTVYSNAQSNSLISGLRGLPHIQGDNASVRTRGTRETRFSVDFTESGERDSVRDSRRHSRTSEFSGRSVRSDVDTGTRDSSPVRPIHSMVGVLPLDEHDTARQVVDTTYPSIPTSLDRTGLITDSNQPRSSTAMDRRIASDSTIRNYGSTRTYGQTSHGQTSQPSRPTDAQRIAASTGWTSSQNSVSSSRVTAEYPPQGSVVSRHRDREGRHRQNRSNRDDSVNHQQQTTAHRPQTSMGVSSSSAWLWDADSNVYPSPLPYSSSSQTHTHHERLSPTSQPLATQPALSTSATSITRSHRLNRHRNYNHGHSYSSTPSRPSLLSSDSLPSFPVSVESTDDERYPNVRSRTSDDGRSTRAGNHDNDLSSDTNVTTPPLQSFGNALGLELITTSNGINAPTPVSRVSTQRFLRSWSNS